MITEYVLGFCMDESSAENRMLLIRKNKPDWQAGKLNGIGGKIEGSEHPDAAMLREFKEETSVDASQFSFTRFCVLEGEYYLVHCYRMVGNVRGAKDCEEGEMVFIDPNDVPDDVMKSLNYLIPMSLDGDIYDSNILTI